MTTFPKTDKTSITRLPKRGSYDQALVYSILDEALVCTIAFVQDGEPYQIPTGFCRIDNYLYIHGSVGSGYMRVLAEQQAKVCISVMHLDGLVLARSAFHHSVNYRSVVLFSHAEKVTESNELYQSLEVFTNKVQPGRWEDIRKPSDKEWKATMVLKFKIEEVSAKIRTGAPKDDDEDYNLPVWAGVVPLNTERKEPIPDPAMRIAIPLPNYLNHARS